MRSASAGERPLPFKAMSTPSRFTSLTSPRLTEQPGTWSSSRLSTTRFMPSTPPHRRSCGNGAFWIQPAWSRRFRRMTSPAAILRTRSASPELRSSTRRAHAILRGGTNQRNAQRPGQLLSAHSRTQPGKWRGRSAATNITTPPNRGNQFGSAHFDPLRNNQRAALLLANGQVYVSWASHCDVGDYQGWVMAFDEQTLQLTSAWTPSPGGILGGYLDERRWPGRR